MKLISSPAKAWEEISMEEDRRKVYIAFVYPMIGLCGLSVFIGSLLTNGWGGPQSFQIAMTNCCAVAVALFGGYFLAAYAINEMGTRMFGMHSNMPLTQQFAGYALVVPFLLQIVTGLLPDFRIIAWLLQFYIVYVVWEGVPVLMGVEEKQRLKYTLLSSVLLILCPAVIQIVINRQTAILNKCVKMKQPPVNIKNKRATFDYELIDTYTAGIVLTGTEIKSIRLGKASLVDTFCYFTKGELWVKNMHIAEYFYGSYNNHTARRERKLLLSKKELEKLQREMKNPGFTIVPVRLFINEKGLAKLVVALAKGKKEYDKRESIKEKDDRRDMARMFKR